MNIIFFINYQYKIRYLQKVADLYLVDWALVDWALVDWALVDWASMDAMDERDDWASMDARDDWDANLL